MEKSDRINIKLETLICVLNKMLDTEIIRADYQIKQLHGGTVGNVNLVIGIAETIGGDKLPYNVVLKIQYKWERYGDPGSWRREYDLYLSDLENLFSDTLRWAKCYHAEINGDKTETQLWVEYIDGVSGYDLTPEMLEYAATELGRFQGRLYKEQPRLLQNISCFTEIADVKDYYMENNMKSEESRYVRSEDCEIPKHLRQMIIDVGDETEKIYDNINNMPVVLCHRDFWVKNIIYSNGKIILLDWDCTGWGYMFEDVIQLITDEIDIKYLEEYYRRLVPAYLKGFSEYTDISWIDKLYAWKMLIIKCTRNFVYWYMSAKSSDEKSKYIDMLQKIYDMRE